MLMALLVTNFDAASRIGNLASFSASANSKPHVRFSGKEGDPPSKHGVPDVWCKKKTMGVGGRFTDEHRPFLFCAPDPMSVHPSPPTPHPTYPPAHPKDGHEVPSSPTLMLQQKHLKIRRYSSVAWCSSGPNSEEERGSPPSALRRPCEGMSGNISVFSNKYAKRVPRCFQSRGPIGATSTAEPESPLCF